MSIVAYEGLVERGQIRLKGKVRLPDNTRVYVVIPDVEVEHLARLATPHLANRVDVVDFKMEVTEESSDAGV